MPMFSLTGPEQHHRPTTHTKLFWNLLYFAILVKSRLNMGGLYTNVIYLFGRMVLLTDMLDYLSYHTLGSVWVCCVLFHWPALLFSKK